MRQQLIHSCCGIQTIGNHYFEHLSNWGAFYTICRKPDYSASQCTLVVVQPPTYSRASSQSQQTRVNICFCWNLKQCVFPCSCSFRHVCQKNHRAINFPKAYAGNGAQLCLNLLSSLSHDAELDSGSNWFCFISFHVGVALPPSFILGLMGMVDSRHQYTDDILALDNWCILWPLGWLLPQALSPVHYYSTAACAALPFTFCPVHSGWVLQCI